MTSAASGAGADWMRNLMPHFLDQTSQRLIQIETHKQAIRGGGDLHAEMKAIGDIAHMISGTADTFGFGDLTVFARAVEGICPPHTPLAADPAMLWSGVEPALTPLMQEMARLLDSR